MSDTIHLAPRPAWGFNGRGYCGKRTDTTTPARSRTTCIDCHAAYRADAAAGTRKDTPR